ncbi:MAG: hypothetical protein J0H69_01380 [Burkholderiales bacterium]|nr:hypothetical protein [Burkholderiales bacterium]
MSKQFVSDVEYGKPTVQMGRVLGLLSEMGLQLTLEVPSQAEAELQKLIEQGGVSSARARAPARAANPTERPDPCAPCFALDLRRCIGEAFRQ